MAKTRKWSEQSLVEQTFMTHDANGKEVRTQVNVLVVCTSGMELFRKHFKEDAYKGKDRLLVPYDFVLLGGDFSPKGDFYEVEYQTEGSYAVYRALLQCVDAVTDTRIMLGCLKRNRLLPDGFKPLRAWKREDIGAVHIASCYKDEDGEVNVTGGVYRAGAELFYADYDDETGYQATVEEYIRDNHGQCCLYYYRGDHREYWARASDKELMEPVFVCGSENVNDPVFAEKKKRDMEEMENAFSEALETARDYGLMFTVLYQTQVEGKDSTFHLDSNMDPNLLDDIIKALREKQNG